MSIIFAPVHICMPFLDQDGGRVTTRIVSSDDGGRAAAEVSQPQQASQRGPGAEQCTREFGYRHAQNDALPALRDDRPRQTSTSTKLMLQSSDGIAASPPNIIADHDARMDGERPQLAAQAEMAIMQQHKTPKEVPSQAQRSAPPPNAYEFWTAVARAEQLEGTLRSRPPISLGRPIGAIGKPVGPG